MTEYRKYNHSELCPRVDQCVQSLRDDLLEVSISIKNGAIPYMHYHKHRETAKYLLEIKGRLKHIASDLSEIVEGINELSADINQNVKEYLKE